MPKKKFSAPKSIFLFSGCFKFMGCVFRAKEKSFKNCGKKIFASTTVSGVVSNNIKNYRIERMKEDGKF